MERFGDTQALQSPPFSGDCKPSSINNIAQYNHSIETIFMSDDNTWKNVKINSLPNRWPAVEVESCLVFRQEVPQNFGVLSTDGVVVLCQVVHAPIAQLRKHNISTKNYSKYYSLSGITCRALCI